MSKIKYRKEALTIGYFLAITAPTKQLSEEIQDCLESIAENLRPADQDECTERACAMSEEEPNTAWFGPN